MMQLTILTLNCLGLPVPLPGLQRRLSAIGRCLAAAAPDVACLQEVGRWRHLPLLRQDETIWPQAIAVTHPYAPKGGLVTLTRLVVSDTSYHPFRARGSMTSLQATERHQAKGILRTVLEVGGQSVVLLNTHLAANYGAQWSYTNPHAKVERAQLQEIAEFVQTVPAEIPVVVAGDFNVPRGSWLYHEFRAAANLVDPLGLSTEPTYRPLPGMPARAAQALDHILVRVPPRLTVEIAAELCFGEPVSLAEGVSGHLSDHLGVRSTIRWAQNGSTAPTAPAS